MVFRPVASGMSWHVVAQRRFAQWLAQWCFTQWRGVRPVVAQRRFAQWLAQWCFTQWRVACRVPDSSGVSPGGSPSGVSPRGVWHVVAQRRFTPWLAQ